MSDGSPPLDVQQLSEKGDFGEEHLNPEKFRNHVMDKERLKSGEDNENAREPAEGLVHNTTPEGSETQGQSKMNEAAYLDRALAQSSDSQVGAEEDKGALAEPEPLVVRHDEESSVEVSQGEEVVAKVGSFSRNENQIVVTEQEPGDVGPGRVPSEVGVETSDLYRFPADSEVKSEPEVEEVGTLEPVDYGKGAVLRVPKTDLEEAGFEPEAGENSIVELKLRDVEREEVETIFARYVASDRRAEAYVGDIGGEKGTRYELVEARECDEDRFVKDFERGRCEHLQNVRLEHVEDKMLVVVDDRRIELEDHRLATRGSHVVMKGKLDGNDNCKFEFDGRRASVKFGRDYPVEEMRTEGDELVIGYAQSKNEKHEHRVYLEHLEAPEHPSLNQFDKPEMLEHVKMFDHPERVEGVYQFVLDKAAQNEIRNLLDEAEKRGAANARDSLKGEIGEVLVPNMLELVGWERIKRHPSNDTKKEGVSANGPDWLLRTPDEKLMMVEVKWWGDRARAEPKGGLQIGKEYDVRRPYQGQEIMGAYVMTVDWNVDESPIRVFVKRVRPELGLI